MRVLIAGLIGGLVIFIWGAVAHMALPLGETGMRTGATQDAAIATLQTTADKGAGIYMLPGMAPEQWADEAARKGFIDKYGASPYAFVVYDPAGNPNVRTMGPALFKQWVSVTLGAILVAWVLSLASAAGFGKRILIAGVMGVFAWLAVNVPYWNWYRFPADFTLAALVEQVVGWMLAGVAIAWWLGRRVKGGR